MVQGEAVRFAFLCSGARGEPAGGGFVIQVWRPLGRGEVVDYFGTGLVKRIETVIMGERETCGARKRSSSGWRTRALRGVHFGEAFALLRAGIW